MSSPSRIIRNGSIGAEPRDSARVQSLLAFVTQGNRKQPEEPPGGTTSMDPGGKTWLCSTRAASFGPELVMIVMACSPRKCERPKPLTDRTRSSIGTHTKVDTGTPTRRRRKSKRCHPRLKKRLADLLDSTFELYHSQCQKSQSPLAGVLRIQLYPLREESQRVSFLEKRPPNFVATSAPPPSAAWVVPPNKCLEYQPR